MKGLILLFLVIAFGMIGWRYMDKTSKRSIKQVASKNIGAVIAATVCVAIAVFFSVNTTLRLV